MWIAAFVLIGCLSGFVLFRKKTLSVPRDAYRNSRKISVIIPARNEEANLPHLLESLQKQTLQPYEVIVVDDGSEDRTREIAELSGVRVVEGTAPPSGWTGKNWAVWNGYLRAAGDVFVFLDADIRLAPAALASLLLARERSKGVVSVVPYHDTEKPYEKLAMILNLLGVFAFTSAFERNNPRKGLYGSCIVALREDYEKINGHESVRAEVLDDLFLGSKFAAAGIPIDNYIGYGFVSFRMYPHGVRSGIEGFAKGAVLSTSTLSGRTVVLVAAWVAGLLLSETALALANTSWVVPLAAGYVLYMLQLFYFNRYVGVFGFILPVLHPIATLYFLTVMVYSLYQVAVLGQVRWKGRQIRVGGSKER